MLAGFIATRSTNLSLFRIYHTFSSPKSPKNKTTGLLVFFSDKKKLSFGRTATVKALIDAGVWGANGHNFKQARGGLDLPRGFPVRRWPE